MRSQSKDVKDFSKNSMPGYVLKEVGDEAKVASVKLWRANFANSLPFLYLVTEIETM